MVRRFLLLLVVYLLPSVSHAQPRVSEEEFLSILQGPHPGLTALTERLGTARAERVRAGLLPNPRGGFEREALRGGTEQTTWRIGWTPPLYGRRGAAVRAAEAGLRAASHDLEANRLALRSELRQTFAEWSLTAERAAVIRSHLVLVERLAAQGLARARSGEESGLAARRLALAALEVRAEAARSGASATNARALAFAWHLKLAADAQAERPPLPTVHDTIETPLRADLLARRFEVEQARWRLRLGRHFLQTPELALGWQRIEEDIATREGPVAGVNWQIPLFERQQPERIEALARLSAAEARFELASNRAVAELFAARAAYRELRQAALQAIETAAGTDQVMESATATFRLGEGQLTDLLETLRSVLAARLAALNLYESALEAHRNLELAAGRALPADGESR